MKSNIKIKSHCEEVTGVTDEAIQLLAYSISRILSGKSPQNDKIYY